MTNLAEKYKQQIGLLKSSFATNNLSSCSETLDSLILYLQSELNTLDLQQSKNPSPQELSEIERKLITFERKFRHILDVPDICLKIGNMRGFDSEKQMLLTIAAILHDIGRGAEIIGESRETVFTLNTKIRHTEFGAKFLVDGDKLTENDRLLKFVDLEIAKNYWQLIRNCVSYHGDLWVPDKVFSPSDRFSRDIIETLMDADKISGLNGFIDPEVDFSTVVQKSSAELSKEHISDLTYHELTHSKPIDRSAEEYTRLRQYFSHVGWIYAVYHPESFSLLDPDFVDKYFEYYQPQAREDQRREAKIKELAIERIESFRK